MSLPIVYRQRFRRFIGRITNRPPQPFPGKTTLAVATKLDETSINDRFRRALNRDDRLGMGDVLKKGFAPGELKGSAKIDEVLATIQERQSVSTMTEYRAMLEPTVHEHLKVILAGVQFPPVEPSTVAPADPLSRYITAANVGDVAKECNERLDKWLLTPAAVEDFPEQGTVAGALDTLLSRMVIL